MGAHLERVHPQTPALTIQGFCSGRWVSPWCRCRPYREAERGGEIGLFGLWSGKENRVRGNGKSGKPFGASSARRGAAAIHGSAEHAEKKFQQPFGIKQEAIWPSGEQAKPGELEARKGQLRHGGPTMPAGETARPPRLSVHRRLSPSSSRWRMRIAGTWASHRVPQDAAGD